MRGRKRQTHCANGHLIVGETARERACKTCRNMAARRHRLNNTPAAEKVRAYKRAWLALEQGPRKLRKPPPRSPILTVCKRGHDRTDPANLTKRNECMACRRYTWKLWNAGEPLPDRRRAA